MMTETDDEFRRPISAIDVKDARPYILDEMTVDQLEC
jgi:hypothetical protein